MQTRRTDLVFEEIAHFSESSVAAKAVRHRALPIATPSSVVTATQVVDVLTARIWRRAALGRLLAMGLVIVTHAGRIDLFPTRPGAVLMTVAVVLGAHGAPMKFTTCCPHTQDPVCTRVGYVQVL